MILILKVTQSFPISPLSPSSIEKKIIKEIEDLEGNQQQWENIHEIERLGEYMSGHKGQDIRIDEIRRQCTMKKEKMPIEYEIMDLGEKLDN